MRNSDQRESSKHACQLLAIRTVYFRKTRKNEREGHVLHQVRMDAGCNEEGIVGIAIWLLDARRFFAILGDGLVTLPSVEIDARLHDIDRKEGRCHYQWDCEATRYWQDLAEAKGGCCVGHGCEVLGIQGRDVVDCLYKLFRE